MKELELLRPFDLEAAKAGELVCLNNNTGIALTYVAGPDTAGCIVFLTATGHLTRPDAGEVARFAMQPLCWIDGRPVYKGSVLWCQVGPIGRQVVVDKLHPHDTQHLLLIDGGIVKADNSAGYLSWEEPKPAKPKTETVKLLAFLTREKVLRWVAENSEEHMCAGKYLARRVPGADRIEEVEL